MIRVSIASLTARPLRCLGALLGGYALLPRILDKGRNLLN